ncbi:MAG TPA: DUF3800 domain-containing protein [Candidatus Acidoferrum sp.]
MDESGDHSLTKIDPQYPVFVLCGVIIDENYHNGAATHALNHFKDQLFGRREIILHTVDFTRNQAGYEAMATHDFRLRFFGELHALIGTLDFKIVACVIRKQEHLRKYGLYAVDPYMLSLSILIERFIFECGSAGGSVIAEGRDVTLNNALELAFLDLKIRGTHYVSPMKVQKRIHGFSIRDKHENITGLQLADVCATPIGRHAIGRSTYPKYSNQGDFYHAVERKLRCDSQGATEGMGLVVLPK